MKKIFSFLTAILFVGSMWAADGDKHDFAQSLQQLLNGGASIASINIAEQSYPVKEVIVSYRYNNTKTDAVTMEVKVAGSSWGTFNVNGTDKSYYTESFTGDAIKGAIAIDFTNNTTAATKCGTFYVDKVTLVEGVTTTPEVTVNPTSWAIGTIGTTDVASKVFSVSGANLTAGDLTLTAPTGFKVEPATINLAADGALAATNVTISKNTTEAGTYEGNLTISGCGLTSAVNVALSMTLVAPVAVTGLTLDTAAIKLETGEKYTLVATIAPSDATNKAITWASTNPSVATVDENGLVTAVAVGTAKISATSQSNAGATDTCIVTVVAAPLRVTITQDSIADFTNSYAEYTWTSGTISGKVYAYKNSGIQLNPSKTGCYIYNTTAIPGKITKIKMTKASGTTRTWDGYVSSAAMTSAGEEGATALTSKEVASTTSWDVTGTNAYFYLEVTGGATVIGSIVIEYEEGGTTAVDNTETNVKAVKKIVNGQLLIEKNGRVYNAFGQTVK